MGSDGDNAGEKRQPTVFKIDRRRKVQLGPEISSEPQIDWKLAHRKMGGMRRKLRVFDEQVAERLLAVSTARKQPK